ncbi:hypothetical protein PVL29_013335 [Vitis rotundifolia]|uniref:Uncharacterized protein n=1 Tax=Vitis rotundifolia TaxID=103349 RepID=A0AA38ZL54_VITRO|nr:hypothetical protein PVL29_013335 [Vitis rotundifolia]
MGDSSHLERMGRELNCPICLSLLNSAVSLTCNHVFCNSCIMKSMKSGSNCPVCKVPYGRREVRPVPHMDSLVSIYKSMEAASGINIFVTQNAPSTKLSDKQQTEGDQNCGGQKADNASEERAKNQRKLKGKGPKRSLKTNPEDSGLNPAKPSFPGKKRVQVPQYPLSETPKRPAKLHGGLSEMSGGGPKNNSVVLNEKPALNDNGELVFSPFFWLREDEDVENSSQQMDGDLALSSSLPNVPSFSDIKGSDDEMPSELTPKGKVDTEFNVADPFDSEIFEWTQRACSPELCSSPMKMQVPDSDEFDEIQDSQGATKEEEVPRTENMNGMNCKEGTGFAAMRLPTMSSPETKKANGQNGIGISKKRGRKSNKKGQKKRAKRGADEVLGIHINAQSVAEDFIPVQDCDKDGSSNLRKKTHKGCEKACFDNNATGAAPENVSSESVGSKSLNPASLDKNHVSDGNLNLKKRGRRCDNVNTQSQKGHTVRSKSQKLESAEDDMLEKGAITPNQINYDMFSHSPCVSLPMAHDGKASDRGEKASKHGRIISKVNQKRDKRVRPSKKFKVSTDDISKYGLIDDTQEGHTKVSAKSTQPINNNQCNPEVRVLDYSSTAKKALSATSGGALRKCESIPNKISCAFCHSAEDSEASGEMLHYFNGRPIAADYNGGSNIIHSHRNCTEWAPNVYFEDGTAVNLKAELTRSRRITCCCCGIKGAALGCYEKSCRKSFHFPCAKLTPQCRWDTDNFVMLCPLHASSMLPNEISEPPAKTRKKCSPKGYTDICINIVLKVAASGLSSISVI